MRNKSYSALKKYLNTSSVIIERPCFGGSRRYKGYLFDINQLELLATKMVDEDFKPTGECPPFIRLNLKKGDIVYTKENRRGDSKAWVGYWYSEK